MGIMLNARTNSYWATRHVLILNCKKVKKTYVDVLLGRLHKEGLTERQKVKIGRKEIWGYRATETGAEWYLDPSVRGSPPRCPKEFTATLLPLEETIEREGWVERWNEQVIHISDYTGKMLRKHMKGRGKGGKPRRGDRANQKSFDCPAFHALTTYGKRTGYTLKLRFRLEPWRDHLALWLGRCGIPLEAVRSIVTGIEKQLPGSFKQQEHRVVGAFGTAVRNVEGRFVIRSEDLQTRRKVETTMEYSRRGEIQVGGDGQMTDAMATALAAHSHNEVIRIAQESGERERMEKIFVLLAQGKNDEVLKMMGIEPEEQEEKKLDMFG
jgi:hypothetical protein